MFRTYFKIAFRSILKHKFFSLINIFGLAVSMSACLLIIVMIADQKKYDQFNTKKDRIYRILSKRDKESLWGGTSPFLLRNELLNSYTGIEKVTTLCPFVGGDLNYQDKTITQAGLYADSSFFQVLDFPLTAGDPNTVLTKPYSMVLKESIASKLFGDLDPVGKTVSFYDRKMDVLGIGIEEQEIDLGEFMVSGIIGEGDYKSHIKFDFLISMATTQSLNSNGTYSYPFDDWKNHWNFYHYVLLEDGKDETYLAGILNDISQKRYADTPDYIILFEPQPLSSITPGKFINNPISFSMPMEGFYFLSFLALIVVFSACFNYTNLSVAKALSRAKEVGLRKINGAQRYQIFFQFISEAILIALVALVFSFLLLQILKSGFRNFWFNEFLAIELNENVMVLVFFVVFSIVLGIIAGVIPALYLSSFSPLRVISKSLIKQTGRKGMFIFKRPFVGKSLVVTQFIFSMILITTTIILVAQLNHLVVAEYGFDRENIINVKLQGNDYNQMAQEMSSHPGVIRISSTSIIPAMGMMTGAKYKKLSEPVDSVDVSYWAVDQNYIENFGLKLIAGRNFPEEISDEKEQYVVINQKAAEELGFEDPRNAIGQFITRSGENEESVAIIGILEDFYFELFMEDIRPLVLRYKPDEFRYANIKITGNDIPGTLAFLENKWKQLDPVHTFNYKFFDEQLAKTNAIFRDVISIIGFISFLSISISSLGLLGMATFTAETRRKEIGIRKVMGASVKGVLLLLSKGFIYLLVIASAVAIPVSYFLNNIWLQEFAYRINMGPSIFLVSLIIIFLIGLITIGSQTLQAALANPAVTLRDE
jgi:putative ABC transport system permease protein